MPTTPGAQHLFLWCRQDFYAPIITAYEAHIAFAPGQSWTGDYRTDFACLLVSKITTTQWPERDSMRMPAGKEGLLTGLERKVETRVAAC